MGCHLLCLAWPAALFLLHRLWLRLLCEHLVNAEALGDLSHFLLELDGPCRLCLQRNSAALGRANASIVFALIGTNFAPCHLVREAGKAIIGDVQACALLEEEGYSCGHDD